MAEDYEPIKQWKDEKTFLKLDDFVFIYSGPHFGQQWQNH